MMFEIAGRAAQVLVALTGAYLVVLWFSLIVWTFRDIESRSSSVFTQVFSTLLSVLFFVPGVLLYLLLRPKQTLDETFQRSLEEEYLLQDLEELPHCPSCHRHVEDDFVLCPNCHGQLREPCSSCERLVDLRWPLCPYCGAAQTEQGGAADKVEPPAARWTAPALRRRRAVGEGSRAPRPLRVPERTTPREVAMVGTRSDSATSGPDLSSDQDLSTFTANLASGVRSVINPIDRLIGRMTGDAGAREADLNGIPERGLGSTSADQARSRGAIDPPDLDAAYSSREHGPPSTPTVVARNRFAANGQYVEHGPGLNGRGAAGESSTPADFAETNGVVAFPSEADRTERRPAPAKDEWSRRDRD